MHFLQTFIVSGDKDYLIGKLMKYGGLPAEKEEALKILPLEALVKKQGELLFYHEGYEPIRTPSISIYYLRKFDQPLKILVSITGRPDFYCFGPYETAEELKKLGFSINEEITTAILHYFVQAAYAFSDKLIDMPKKYDITLLI